MLSPFTMPDTVCQLNDEEFAADLFTVDDVNNDAIFDQCRFRRFATNKYVNKSTVNEVSSTTEYGRTGILNRQSRAE